MEKRRLDTLLAERGLFPSRSRAAASVMAGEVRVGGSGRRAPVAGAVAGGGGAGRGGGGAQMPGELGGVEEPVSVDERPAYVSRGGIKLANALSESGLAVAG